MNCRWKTLGEGRWECVTCKREYSERVRREKEPPPRNCNSPNEPCKFLGKPIGTTPCESCQGTVRIKLYACALHEQCTIGKRIEMLACCAQCDDYEPSKRDTADDGRSG